MPIFEALSSRYALATSARMANSYRAAAMTPITDGSTTDPGTPPKRRMDLAVPNRAAMHASERQRQAHGDDPCCLKLLKRSSAM